MDYSSHNSPVVGFNESMSRLARRKRTLMVLFLAAAILVVVVGVIIGLRMLKGGDAATAISASVASANIAPAGVSPATVHVKPGQPITWVNQDVRPHRLTADQSMIPGFDTVDVLNQGDSYTYIFETKGTFHYYDPADPKAYVGTVIVE